MVMMMVMRRRQDEGGDNDDGGGNVGVGGGSDMCSPVVVVVTCDLQHHIFTQLATSPCLSIPRACEIKGDRYTFVPLMVTGTTI